MLTDGGEECSKLIGFDTVWDQKDDITWVSNDKSVFPDTDLINSEIVNGDNSYYMRLSKQEEELTNLQLAITEIVENSLS